MTDKAAAKLTEDCNKASKDYDDNHRIVKIHTITIGANSMSVSEMASGYCNSDGHHVANSYDEMVSMLSDDAVITTEEL